MRLRSDINLTMHCSQSNLLLCLSRCKNYLQVAGKFGIAFDECGISPQYADIIPTGTHASKSSHYTNKGYEAFKIINWY